MQRSWRRKHQAGALLVALVFGLFQAGMAALGALGGGWLMAFAAAWDHWLAAGLLALIGGKMLLARQEDEPTSSPSALTVLTPGGGHEHRAPSSAW